MLVSLTKSEILALSLAAHWVDTAMPTQSIMRPFLKSGARQLDNCIGGYDADTNTADTNQPAANTRRNQSLSEGSAKGNDGR